MQTSDTDNFFRTEADLLGEQARNDKFQRNKNVGDPIDLGAKVIKLVVRGDEAWTAESSKVVRRVDLKTGKVLQVYKGHSGPVTSLAFHECTSSDGQTRVHLITGSWDKTVRVWDTQTKTLISETQAHGDFVKSLLVIQSTNVLVTGSSDKTAKLWDLGALGDSENASKGLNQLASLSGHRRPVEALAMSEDTPNTLVTGDSMGVIKIWELEDRWKSSLEASATIRATVKEELSGHRTGINEAVKAPGRLWTGSTDQTVVFRAYPLQPSAAPISYSLEHQHPVKCLLDLSHSPIRQSYLLTGSGDVIRVYDISELVDDNTEDGHPRVTQGTAHLLHEIDVHSQPVTSLALWIRRTDENSPPVPWIVSSSLDGTLRRWNLSDLISGTVKAVLPITSTPVNRTGPASSTITEEEERELAELMEED
ncbi:hypothetical protein FRB99_008726 [Tulasnella sp. 403]|nr:hypothetical protein FRB99_008726 [Tulasnella sp. 403]